VNLTAYVDESIRGQSYLFAAVLLSPQRKPELDRLVRSLCLPGQRRLHLISERDARRRQIIDAIANSGRVRARIYRLQGAGHEIAARAACLRELVTDVSTLGAGRIILDRMQERQVVRDRQVIIAAVSKLCVDLSYEHAESREHSGLQAADILAWGYGAGGEWRRRTMPAIEKVIEVSS
jgi:hypothetical protein